MIAVSLPLRFQVGARTLASVSRQMVRVPLSLEQAMASRLPALPPLDRGTDGYLVTSLPVERRADIIFAAEPLIAFDRQQYTRYFVDLSGNYEAYLAGLSANTRSSIRRKARKLADLSGGMLDVRRFRTPPELIAFHNVARQLSALTYQHRLLGSGLPDDPLFLQSMCGLGAADSARAWLLYLGGKPIAYLYCQAEGATIRYDYVGHDPACNDLSPGSVLQMEAMRDLFVEQRFTHFDFTEGEGQHKRQFATNGVDCFDLLLLRATFVNRATLAALSAFDRSMAQAKRLTKRFKLEWFAHKLRR